MNVVASAAPRRGRPTKLAALIRGTPDLYNRMLDLIRHGAYAWIAAQAVGIAPETFSRWLAKGRRGARLYRQFRQEVEQAAAQARVSAQIQLYRNHPKQWLRRFHRSSLNQPGWGA